MPCIPALLAALALAPHRAAPSDHGDTPLLDSIARPDAKITDLHAFVRGDRLVLSLCTNPAIPPGTTSYVWPADVSFEIHVDVNARVAFQDPDDLATYGGTLLEPAELDGSLRIRFQLDASGQPQALVSGRRATRLSEGLELFSGLRDDPFIRGPRIGRNVAALVVSLDLDDVVKNGRPLVLWATSSIAGRPEPFQDLAGRSLRSMFPENDFMNTAPPRDHWIHHAAVPDVTIFDTRRAAAFPNGRELTDDVVDLVGHQGTLANDAPFPSANDVPFLDVFPYLAPPQ